MNAYSSPDARRLMVMALIINTLLMLPVFGFIILTFVTETLPLIIGFGGIIILVILSGTQFLFMALKAKRIEAAYVSEQGGPSNASR